MFSTIEPFPPPGHDSDRCDMLVASMSSLNQSNPDAAARPSPRKKRRLAIWAGALLLTGVVGAEVAARYVLGLGDPPLYVLDPRIEYMLAPSQDCRRFGNVFQTNRFGMRSDELSEKKSSPDELRVVVVGDSIVNGGARIDQSDLATSVLQRELRQRLGRVVTVANISAGSWGPINQLAYLEKYGLFDADIVLLVLNSEDAADVPGLEAIGPQWPRHKPVLALQELGERFLPRLTLPLSGNAPPTIPPIAHTTTREQDLAATKLAVARIVELAKTANARLVLVRYATQPELGGSPSDALVPISSLVRDAGAHEVIVGEAFRTAMQRGEIVFQGDGVHPTVIGQRLLGEELARIVASELQAAAASTK